MKARLSCVEASCLRAWDLTSTTVLVGGGANLAVSKFTLAEESKFTSGGCGAPPAISGVTVTVTAGRVSVLPLVVASDLLATLGYIHISLI